MKSKKVWISVALAAIVITGVILYLNYGFQRLSPAGDEELTSGGMTVSVKYHRPSVRGRAIFGPKDKNPLQPYGEYWRLGANAATKITFDRNVLFNGSSLNAGTYRMYAVPGQDFFEIILNTEAGVSGSEQPDPNKDVLRTKVPVQQILHPVETFTISLAPEGEGVEMVFEWSDVRFEVPLKVQE
jgi:hypothetical protein